MKKLLFLVCSVFTIQFASAQTEYTVPTDFPENTTKRFEIPQQGDYRGVIVTEWYDFGLLSNQNYSGDNAPFINAYLFPDSAYFQVGASTYARGSNYKEAVIIDPKADLFKTLKDPDFGKFLSYNVDSITILFQYYRNTSADIVDTLFVEVGSDSTVSTGYLSGAANYGDGTIFNNFGANSLAFKVLKFQATVNGVGELDIPKKEIIPILLTPDYAGDVNSPGISSLTIHPYLSRFKGGQNIVVGLSFKPGFKYSKNDTLTKTGNTFNTFAWEEQGPNTFQQYNAGEWNCSYWAYYDNMNPMSSWYEAFYPSWIWPKDFPEHHWLRAKTSYDDDWLGVNPSAEISIGNCFPNPATNEVLIAYSLKGEEQISVRIYDIAGQLIFQKEEGKQIKGQHFAQINLNDFSSGIYFYSLNGGEMKKFVKE
ncbi:MAG: T9SS type A sorting domain-containing protein [Bacteroidetes bacterium]|nr:T9SS type A sorting domain-containing protein [Bacteroidota bacterium]